jgi:UDP-glucose 4-epimerase
MCKIKDLLFFVNFYSRLVAGSEKMKEKVGWVPAYPDLETIIETAWR